MVMLAFGWALDTKTKPHKVKGEIPTLKKISKNVGYDIIILSGIAILGFISAVDYPDVSLWFLVYTRLANPSIRLLFYTLDFFSIVSNFFVAVLTIFAFTVSESLCFIGIFEFWAFHPKVPKSIRNPILALIVSSFALGFVAYRFHNSLSDFFFYHFLGNAFMMFTYWQTDREDLPILMHVGVNYFVLLNIWLYVSYGQILPFWTPALICAILLVTKAREKAYVTQQKTYRRAIRVPI